MNNKQGINWAEIEPLCVIKLLLRKLWLLVLAFLIGFMSVTIVLNGLVTHSYSCSAIFAVTARTAYSTNTSAATEVVNIYTELLQGRFMDELIRQDLGITDGTLSASQVDDTNLITLTVTSNSENGDMEEKIDVTTEGKDLTIAFNVRYITDVLKAISDDEVFMRFNSNVSPCVVCPTEGDSYLYLVLPVRVFGA